MNYALLAGRVEDSQFIVLHMCLYGEVPTDADVDSLYLELLTDEEFGLCDEDFVLRRAEVCEDEIKLV